jgi:large subunit ribosomal protein L24
MKLKIKKGDNVKVIAGSGKGHTGSVLDIDSRRLQIKVTGHNMQTHFDKENGISQKEGFVDYSNVKAEAGSTRKKTAKKKAAKKA